MCLEFMGWTQMASVPWRLGTIAGPTVYFPWYLQDPPGATAHRGGTGVMVAGRQTISPSVVHLLEQKRGLVVDGAWGDTGCPLKCMERRPLPPWPSWISDRLSDVTPLQTMDREFRKWMKWYGKKHAEYTVSAIAPCPHC